MLKHLNYDSRVAWALCCLSRECNKYNLDCIMTRIRWLINQTLNSPNYRPERIHGQTIVKEIFIAPTSV